MSDAPRKIVRKLKLTDPIHDAGRTIETLEFGRPKARIYRLIESMSEVSGSQVLALIADLCDISEEAVEELDWDDANAASEIVGELLTTKKKGSRVGSKPRRAGGKR